VDDWPRQRAPSSTNDPPGYQSREAVRVKAQRPTGNVAGAGGLGSDDLRAAPERQ